VNYERRATNSKQSCCRGVALSLQVFCLAALLAGCPLRGAPPAASGTGSTVAPQSSQSQARPAERDCPEQSAPAVRLRPPSAASAAAVPSLARAVQLHDDGDLEAAREEGRALLESLQAEGVDSMSLRFLLGTWALEAEDGLSAEAQFEIVRYAGEDLQALSEQSESQLRVARSLAYGADAVALAEAKELFETGHWSAAEERIKLLFLRGEDGNILQQAEVFRDQMDAELSELGASLLGQADALLSGSGPYDEVEALLARVEELPKGTWNHIELVRLRKWYDGMLGAVVGDGAGSEEVGEQQSQVLDDARALVVSMDYRGALKRFAELEGTSLQATARLEAGRAADTLVKEERVRAGRLFVVARKKEKPEVRLAALTEVRLLLATLSAEFPASKYAKRVRDNLVSVDTAIEATRMLVGELEGAP